MENLERYRKEIFQYETSAGDEGVIAESINIVNDEFNLTQEQMIEALKFLYSIKDEFLGKTKKVPPGQIWEDLSVKIIKHLGLKNIVKQVCKELGITQRELAERMGVSQNMPAKWAMADTEPSNMAIKFMELLIEHEKVKSKLDKFEKAFALIDEARS